MPWPVLVFDIESIPDIAGLRALRGACADATDESVYSAWCEERSKDGKSDFMPLHLQRVLVISCVFRNAEGIRVHSFVDRDNASEGKVIQTFFNALEKHVPQLVSWNGGGFDLPVLHYRALLHGISAPRYWDTGNDDPAFRYNNYLGRFHWRHIDLMDVLSAYQPRASAKLDEIATLLGFPGKMGVSGKDVWPSYLAGELPAIRAYCETDVLNTYLVYLSFERMRGHLLDKQYHAEVVRVRHMLRDANKPHLNEFLDAWPDDAASAAQS